MRRGAGVDEDFAGGYGYWPIGSGDFRAVRSDESSAAGQHGDIVLVGELVIILVSQHGGDAALFCDCVLECRLASFGRQAFSGSIRLFGRKNQRLGWQAPDIDAGAAVHVGARFCDDDFMAGCAELGRQCLASFAESDNQDICGDGGGESGVGGHGMLPCVRCEQFAGGGDRVRGQRCSLVCGVGVLSCGARRVIRCDDAGVCGACGALVPA